MASPPAVVPEPTDPWSDPRLIVPSAERWAAMSEEERAGEEQRILDVLDGYREAMAEGTPHSRPKIGTYNDLGDHFKRAGRRVFLATQLAVLYPGYPTLVPDLLAVMDVADPDRERNAWRVPDEGRGIDLVLEFRNLGKKHKDLVDNVKDYGKLGIAEYFALDCRTKILRAWRLPSPTARTYTQMMPQGGVYPSGVLGLEVGMVEGRLRFFKDSALVPTTLEILGRVQKMADTYQERIEEAERERDEAQRRQREADERLSISRAGLARVLLETMAARGLALTEEQRREVAACDDFDRLLRWVARAATVATAEGVLSA
jgi:Uma2 family endonuclease